MIPSYISENKNFGMFHSIRHTRMQSALPNYTFFHILKTVLLSTFDTVTRAIGLGPDNWSQFRQHHGPH